MRLKRTLEQNYRSVFGGRKRIYSSVAPALTDQAEAAHDVWKPFQSFVGAWEGRGEGQPGVSTGMQKFQFILGGRFLHVRNEARFEPQEKNPKGEIHQGWGFFSYDRIRKTCLN